MASGLLFLCARGSGRALLAASLLQSRTGDRFDIWSTPIQDTQEQALVERILQEQGVPLLASDHLIQPTFGMHWDEGIILCSGLADTCPIIPGAGRHRFWSIEDAPALAFPYEEQLLTYHQIRDALLAWITPEWRFPGRMLAVVPQHK